MKKHQFLRIWLRVTIPIVLVSVAALSLVLIMTMTTMSLLAQRRIEYIALEDAMILQENPELLQSGDLLDALNLDRFHMVAVLYDSTGREIARSDIEKYNSGMVSRERLTYIMEQVEGLMDAGRQGATLTAAEPAGIDSGCHYGLKGIHSDAGDYLFAYGGVTTVRASAQRGVLLLGFGILAFVLLLTTMIAASFYRMHKKEIRLEEYYILASNAIAHDLKTPMMAASGYAENLMENVHTEKRKYYAQAILNNVERMNHILETMLQLSNPDSLKNTLNRQEINLLALTKEVLAQYKDLLDAREINLSVSGEAMITADPVLMRRVIDNLVSNAVKYTPSRENIRIRMSDQEYEMENTGVSIARRRRRDMWKPFERADGAGNAGTESLGMAAAAQAASAGNSGIGLTIVKEILDVHGFRCRLTGDRTKVTVKIRF